MVASIKLWNEVVGAILWDPIRQVATIEFDKDFSKHKWDVAPITMPLIEIENNNRLFSFPELNKDTYKGLPGLLADALPDNFGNKLINNWLATQGKTPEAFNPVERLCYMGIRSMGALEFEPSAYPLKNTSKTLDISILVELARLALNEKEALSTNIKNSSAMADIISVGTSAGGARAKAVIAYNATSGEIKSGQVGKYDVDFEEWILKFDGVTNATLGDPKGYGKIEYTYYLMATACGIEMNPCRLMEENGRAHFMTKRFDRNKGEKHHMQTLCGIAHLDYNQANAYAYEQIFMVMRRLALPYTAAAEMYKRMVFNVIARNQDDHTKNTSFLMNKLGHWKLSPGYDITYAHDPANKWMHQHQLSINGKRNDIGIKDFLAVAKAMNIKKPMEIIESVKDAVSQWPILAASIDMPKSQIKAIQATHLLGTQ